VTGDELRVKPTRSQVDEMRQVKDNQEIGKIRKSMEIVEKVFELVKKKLRRRERSRPFPTEVELAKFITSVGLKMGAEDLSFPAIVASGANAAIPHHVPGAKPLKAGESIIIDFGFKYKNYCSDFTRTVFLKKVPKRLEVAYNCVENAYLGAMDFISSKKVVTGNDVYQRSVEILAEKKLDKYFIHSLGHGTGLEIHELPNLSPKSKDELKNGMVFSIEPGVYMPKIGGIRIEDLVYLENGKVKKFINVPTALKENIL
jgi:Xaa-Pro aminopeptidase